MAGRGTGLPGIERGPAVTSMADMSSFGASERATAEALAQAGESIGRFQRQVVSPLLEDKARKDAAQDVLAGRVVEQPSLTEYGRAYGEVMTRGTLARYSSEDDRWLEEQAAKLPTDPDSFQAAAQMRRSHVITEETPGFLAVQRAETFDRRANDLLGNIRVANVRLNTAESGKSIMGRLGDVSLRISQRAEHSGAFDPNDPQTQGDMGEIADLWTQVIANPVLGINEEEGRRLQEADMDRFRASAVAGHVRTVFRTQGRDAALAELQTLLPPVGGPAYRTPSAPRPVGLVEPGNIDLSTRPTVQNDDGTISTVRSITIEADGKAVLIPTVTDDGRVVSDDEAVTLYQQTGRHLGVFGTEAEADAYAETLHDDQANGRDGGPGMGLHPRARQLAYDLASTAIDQESGVVQQRANIATAARTQASQRVDSLIEAMRYGGDVDPEELRAAAQATGDVGTINRARWAIEVGVAPPEGFGGGGGASAGGSTFDGDASAAGGFDAWSSFFFRWEGGDALIENDNGRGPSRWGINQDANPDLNVRTLAGDAGRRVAAQRLRRGYWDEIGADRLPPALAFVAADAAAVAGPQRAKAWIDKADGDVARFLTLQEDHYRALAERDPAKYGDDLRGWLNRLGDARRTAVRIQSFANNQAGFANDPLSFALGNSTRPALAQVAPLPTEAVFSPQGRGVWSQVLQQRRATGETLASQYQVPRRMLTDGEVSFYRDRLERDPAAALTLAQAATAAVGGQGAKDLLTELGQGGTAPTLIHIADIGRPGGDVRFAQQAALGLSLKTSGQTLSTDKRDDVNQEVTRWRPLLAANPALLSAVQNAAQAAALADDASGVVRPPSYYVQAALGRTTWGHNTYGGAAEVNGASVIVPRWMNGARFDDVLETLSTSWAAGGHGPVFGNGDPMPARTLARLRPVLQSNGNYRLVDQRGATASRRNGQPFEINLNVARTVIEGSLGRDVVRPD